MRKEDKYRELIKLQEDSGLSVRAFCTNQCIAPATYYYWRKKFNEQQQGKGFIPLIVESTWSSASKPVVQNSQCDQTIAVDISVNLTYPNGVVLRLDEGIAIPDLKALINLGG